MHFCLFFYKSSDVSVVAGCVPLLHPAFDGIATTNTNSFYLQDDFPLASLPVIGYTVTVPSDADNMSKSYVFKLQFKAHIYFFRAESEYAFNKWMEVIKKSTSDTTTTLFN